MAASYRVQMKQWNGTGFDEIYPKCKNLMSPEIVIIPNEGDEATGTVTNNETKETYEGIVNHDRTISFIVNKFGSYHISARSMVGLTLEKDIEVTECSQYKLTFFPAADPILNNNLWETIRAYSDKGLAESTWAVGDTKQIAINGKVGNTTLSNLTINVFILGFNHNASKEGNNRIHFQIGKIGTTPVALCDAQYNSGQSSNGYFNWNPNNSNSGGWKSCYKRSTLYGNSGTPTSPVSNSLMAALPSDLRAVMQPVTKYTDNVGNNTGNVQSNVTSTTDYLFDLAEFEVFGTRYVANTYEQNYQLQYDYYKAGNSKVAYKHSAVSTAVWWGLRSPRYTNANYFVIVGTGGTYYTNSASYSGGLRPGFAA